MKRKCRWGEKWWDVHFIASLNALKLSFIIVCLPWTIMTFRKGWRLPSTSSTSAGSKHFWFDLTAVCHEKNGRNWITISMKYSFSRWNLNIYSYLLVSYKLELSNLFSLSEFPTFDPFHDAVFLLLTWINDNFQSVSFFFFRNEAMMRTSSQIRQVSY